VTETSPSTWDRSARLGVALVMALLVARWGLAGLGPNAADVLVHAHQQADPGWIPGDWTATRSVPYRWLFNTLAGPVLTELSVDTAATLIRCSLAVAMGAALVALMRALKVVPALWVPVVALVGVAPSLGAGEWILLAAEAKCAAWAAVLGGLAAWLRGRDRVAWLLLGLGISFHALVGGFVSIAVIGAALVNRRWGRLRALPWLVPLALPGLVATGRYLAEGQAGLDPVAQVAVAEVYVQFRMAHHLVPSAWADGWGLRLVGVLAVLGFARWRGSKQLPREPLREVIDIAGVTAIFGVVGWVILFAGATSLLRFFWFRVPDVVLPLVAVLAVAVAASRWSRVRPVAWALTLALLLWSLSSSASLNPTVEPVPLDPAHVATRELTPPGAVVLTDPTDAIFTLRTGRARVVSFKQVPHAERDVAGWITRLEAVTGRPLPPVPGMRARPALRAAFRAQTPAERREVAATYDVTHALLPTHGAPPEWPVLWSDGTRVLVAIQ
jgi:hypothetical protein